MLNTVFKILFVPFKLTMQRCRVYWIEPLTLDQRVPGSIPVNAWHFCASARHYIHIAALHPGI